MNTTENNKLIAEFMGQTEIIVNIPFTYEIGQEMPTSNKICKSVIDAEEEVQTEIDEGNLTGCDVMLETPRYHTSWDWLMPVIEKIEETEVNGDYATMIIQQGSCEIEMFEYRKEQKDGEKFRVFFFQGSKIDATYKAVVDFIKWYNENK